MGTKFAPTYATLVLGYLEEKLYTQIENKYGEVSMKYIETNWKRFLDDCFTVWNESKEMLEEFHKLLNNLHADLKFTVEFNTEELPFLDVLVIKKGNTIETDMFYKPTDSKQYLNFKSCHPKHTKKNIPYNLARRICTIVSDKHKKQKRLKELKGFLLQQNYPELLIEDAISKATELTQEDLRTKRKMTKKEDIIPYISTYNPRNPEAFSVIQNNLPILQKDQYMAELMKGVKIIKSKRQPPNIKKILTRAKFDYHNSDSNTVQKCGRPNCKLCEYIIEGPEFDFNGKKFKVKQSMSCNVRNVLYVIKCAGCNQYYIGQTGDTLRHRRTVHSQQIRDPSTRQIPLSAHIEHCAGNLTPNYTIFPFYKLTSENSTIRNEKEKYFINLFKPKLNGNSP